MDVSIESQKSGVRIQFEKFSDALITIYNSKDKYTV